MTYQLIQYREAQFADLASIARLHAESWRHTYRGIYSNHFLDHEVEQNRLDAWQKKLKSPEATQQVTVAIYGEEVIAFSCLYLNHDSTFGSYLDNLHVSLNWQKHGIGKRLLQQCAETILEKGETGKMYLWVYEKNEPARKMYEKSGALNFETLEHQTEDGLKAQVCRYTWDHVSALLH